MVAPSPVDPPSPSLDMVAPSPVDVPSPVVDVVVPSPENIAVPSHKKIIDEMNDNNDNNDYNEQKQNYTTPSTNTIIITETDWVIVIILSIGLPLIAIILLFTFIYQRKCKEKCDLCCKKCKKNRITVNRDAPVVQLEEGRKENSPAVPRRVQSTNVPKKINPPDVINRQNPPTVPKRVQSANIPKKINPPDVVNKQNQSTLPRRTQSSIVASQVNRIERKKMLVRKIKSEKTQLNTSNETNGTQDTVEQKSKIN
jgi:hypothetical protein